MALTPPQPLADHHRLVDFTCGVASLDTWLARRARANQAGNASHTYIVNEGDSVAGYYALATGGVAVVEAPGRFRRNMPDPIPVAVLGRLAVDTRYHGRGLGRALLRDAALRVLQASDILGIRGLIVHAISDEARAFYLALGLEASPLDSLTLMAGLADLRALRGA